MKTFRNLFDKLVSIENLFSAWDGFKEGKRSRPDVILFEQDLEANIFELRRELVQETYQHSSYSDFFISDPKRRHIHKAEVRDRVVHHAVFSVLNPIFEKTFITDSFSCRIGKGTHRGVTRVSEMLRQVSKNNARRCYVLKCDVRKFFDSVDHEILLSMLRKKINDPKTMDILERLIRSYETSGDFDEREREYWALRAQEEYLSGTLLPNCLPMSI